jgi:hypothetical protein
MKSTMENIEDECEKSFALTSTHAKVQPIPMQLKVFFGKAFEHYCKRFLMKKFFFATERE